MRLLARVISVIIFVVSLILITHHSSLITREALAQGEFLLDYKVRYQVETNGLTRVTQDIVLKNQTANYYADTFELKIGSTKVQDVKAQDASGPMPASVKFDDNLTIITVKFNQKVIGSGKTLQWTLSYSSTELATKSGQIWEISIPRLAKSQDIGAYEAVVDVPIAFGPIAFTTPKPVSQNKTKGTQEFSFTKDQLYESGIAMSFGEKQVFSFSLDYFLENKNLTSQFMSIALPPDNNYQKIVLEKIEPPPVDVTRDEDGNYMAKYRLSAGQSVTIQADGFVEVFSTPFRKIDKNLTSAQRNTYLQPQRYWEKDTAAIGDKAKELKTSQKIYAFVTEHLSYSQERLAKPDIERLGALAAINTPSEAVCMEFTDLFIALARAAGIPAREVEGYAFTQNERLRPLSLALTSGDVLHAWPEYWDEELGWVQVDPTWGSTSGGLDYFNKLDFNHITFVQRGLSSTSPYPAGAYKKPADKAKKDVQVAFADELPVPTSASELSFSPPGRIISGFPLKVEVNVKNVGSTAIDAQKLKLVTNKLKITTQNEYEVEILPPYSSRNYSFTLLSESPLTNGQDTLILSFADNEITKPIRIDAVYKILVTKTFLISLTVSSGILVIGLLLYKRLHKKKVILPDKLKV